MSSSLTLISSGFAGAISLAILVVVLRYGLQRPSVQFFAVFLFMVLIWSVADLLLQVVIVMRFDIQAAAIVGVIRQIGFSGAGISLYVLTSVLTGIQTRWFRTASFAGLLLVVTFSSFPIVNNPESVIPYGNTILLVFLITTVYLLWHYRNKINSLFFQCGALLFIFGQMIAIFNTASGILQTSLFLATVGALVLSFSTLEREIITPIAKRQSQVKTVQEISRSIINHSQTSTILGEIARRAAEELRADASGIFIIDSDSSISLRAVYQLPDLLIGNVQTRFGEGIVGTAIERKRSILQENYARDWHGAKEVPQIANTFGSVICAPLIYANQAIGAILVIAGKRGTSFQIEDVELVELLCSQAAIAITYDVMLQGQRLLTDELLSANEHLQGVMEGTESLVIAVDRKLRVVFCNPAAIRTLNLNEESTEERNLLQLVDHVLLPSDVKSVYRSTRRGEYVYEVSIGDNVYSCHIARLGGKQNRGWVAVLNDITQLKELDRIKSEMLRMTSHDLKNPLQAAFANLDLLREDINPLDAEQVDTLNRIERQLLKMERIIRGILDLERIRIGAHLENEYSIAELIQEAVDELSDMASAGSVVVEVHQDSSCTAVVDPEHFKRAMVNLLENAIKFSHSGDMIQVHLSCSQDEFLVVIRDYGVGIASEDQGKVFERFYRAVQPGYEHVTGSGLGLSLVKTVVDSHNGKIQLKSDPGFGTEVRIQIPRRVISHSH